MGIHQDIWELEKAAMLPSEWEWWLGAVREILGFNPDGDQDTDGYSVDDFYIRWERGETPRQAAAAVLYTPLAQRLTVGWDMNRNA